MKKKISFIVPVYNVEKYLSKCLQSLICQDLPYDMYEIIVINDGSTDNSLTIAQDMARIYPNITIFSQQNGGLSVARNSGLNIAKGEYVWFVDADDYIRENCLSRLIDTADSYCLDMLDFYMLRVDEDGKTISEIYNKPEFPFDQVVDGNRFMTDFTFYGGVCHFLFRNEFLKKHNLRFMPGIYHEDEEFTPRALVFAQRVMVKQEACYFYLKRTGSILDKKDEKHLEKKLRDLMTVLQRLKQTALDEEQSGNHCTKGLNKRINMLSIGLFNRIFSELPSKSFINEVTSTLLQSGLYPVSTDKGKFSHRIYASLINHHLGITFLLFVYKFLEIWK